METLTTISPEATNQHFDLESDVAYWIREVEEELREINRQEHQLMRERSKYEGTLLWLKNLNAGE